MSDLEYDAGFKGLLGENAYYLLKVFVKEGKINGASIKAMADRMKVSGVYDENKSLSREPLFDKMLEKWWMNEGRNRTGRLSSPTKAREILLDILEKSYVENIYQSEIRDAMEPIPEFQSKSLTVSSNHNTAITTGAKLSPPEALEVTGNHEEGSKIKWKPSIDNGGRAMEKLATNEEGESSWQEGPQDTVTNKDPIDPPALRR